MNIYLSGIQPSGTPHLGNYFGAIRHHITLSKLGDGEALFFIADYHSLTTFDVEKNIGELSFDVACTYLALGLDTSKAVLFRQSDVPEVCELNWILACCTGMGLLKRAHSYKDKVAKGLVPNVGLFTYPVLMAADILAYNTTHVPVGQDQIQHVQMAQDMSGSFNAMVQEKVLVYPKTLMGEAPKVPGTDGQKMSKSYGNTIDIFAEGPQLKRALKAIVTDNRRPDEPKDPDGIPLFGILSCFLTVEERKDFAERIKTGGEQGPGYGEMKALLAERIESEFGEARERYKFYKESVQGKGEVVHILAEGASKVRPKAQETLRRCYDSLGMESASQRMKV
jgi:tryptophanyl-tRNA synthetase